MNKNYTKMKISTGETKEIEGEYLLPSGGSKSTKKSPQKERLEGGRFGGRESKNGCRLEKNEVGVAGEWAHLTYLPRRVAPVLAALHYIG